MVKRISYLILLLFVALVAVLPGFFQFFPVAHAAVLSYDSNFDKTSVEEDLSDEISDTLKYPRNPLGTPQIIEFVEYCYSDDLFAQGNYGLYIYVYNPSQIEFSTKAGANSVMLSDEHDEKGVAVNYSNVDLTFLSCSTSEGKERLFYKFKVTSPTEILKAETALSVTTGERRYDVAGIQLRTLGAANAIDYKVGGSWHYKGYAKGYGEGAEKESTLEVAKTDLETLETTVHYTYYRPEFYNNAQHFATKDQLNAVYFSVPERFFNDYGDIYSVVMDWWEYRTQPIWVISDLAAYNSLKSYVGRNISSLYTDENGWASSHVGYGMAAGLYPEDGTLPNFWNDFWNLGLWDINHMSCAFAYNMRSKFCETVKKVDGEEMQYLRRPDIIYNLYYRNSKSISTDTISGQTLIDDWLKYSEGKTDLILGKYASELFTEEVGEGRTPGYNKLEIYATDEYNLTSVAFNDNWFTRLFGKVYGDAEYFNGIKAIEEIPWDDSIAADEGNAIQFCSENYIDYSTFDEFAKAAIKANANGERIVMIRFAATQYSVVGAATYTYEKSDNWMSSTTDDGYLATENVFLDLDLIQLTFERDGEYIVIPVVASPIDGVAGISAPPKPDWSIPWWVWFLIVLGIILLLLLLPIFLPILRPIFKAIFKVIWWLISAPFRFIAWVVKKIKARHEEKKQIKRSK